MGEVTCGRSPHLSCKGDQIIMRDYMDRQVTPPTWGPPPPCKQSLKRYVSISVLWKYLLFSPVLFLFFCPFPLLKVLLWEEQRMKMIFFFCLICQLLYNLYFQRVTPLTMKSILPSGPLKTKLIIINYNNHDKKPIYK